ncbi:unnamed protein product, partial [Laminaria digitata]
MIDVLTLQGVTVTVTAGTIRNFEVLSVVDSTIPTIAAICGGSTTIGGTSMIGSVLGCVSDDTIVVTDDAVVTMAVEGAGGADVISVTGNASVAGLVRGGGDGQDGSAASDGADVITIDTTGSVGGVMGDAGDDRIALLSGSADSVSGGDGDDMVTLDGASVAGAVTGDAGTDVLALLSGSAD